MLRLTRKHRTRVPNQIAVIAAVLLVVAATASLGETPDLLQFNSESTQTQVNAGDQEVATGSVSTKRMKKKFKVSLMLLPRR